ncbi:MAG: response regulator [SAR324 cluster bacterium]|nr:response regulator [SAR324 cluster bacterium]
MAGERRRYLRVLFEETIQVETADWTDPMATGLDISLNGTRFHCEHSLTEGAKVDILFRSDLKLEGEVRWCWPIEWYYQAAVEFTEISEDEKNRLKSFISETTGEPYPDFSEDELESEAAAETEDESAIEDDEFLMDEDSLSNEEGMFSGTLTPFAFAEKQVIIVDDDSERVDAISQYLIKRNKFAVENTDKKSRLWPLMKAHPADVILLSWSLEGEDGIEMLNGIQERSPGIPVIFLAGSVSLEERLEGLNGGAADFITRPVSISSISQSILRILASLAMSSGTGGSEDSSEEDLGLGDEEDFSLDGDDDLEFNDDFLDEDLEL